jgi:hypothetical protein
MPETPADLRIAAREIFGKWEWLRLIYNLVLIVFSFPLAWPLLARMGPGRFLAGAALWAVGANVCFLLGPAVELLLVRLGWGFRGLRYVLFIPGLLLSLYVAFWVIGLTAFVVLGSD